MRLEMMIPWGAIMKPQTYNALFYAPRDHHDLSGRHPCYSISFWKLFSPIQIGARDVAFPRINPFVLVALYLRAAIVLISVFTGGGPPDTGWTFYVRIA